MEKKYIIAAVVVVVLFGAFMGYRQMKRKEMSTALQKDTYSRMLEMAKKSPRGGLTQMARALNRYYQDHKTYPDSLNALYPKYIPSMALITDIQWEYERGDGDFLLTKTGVYNDREMVASVDRSLRAEMESSGVAVARRKVPPPKRKVRVAAEAPEEEAVEYAELKIVDEFQMTGKETDVVVAAAGADIVRTATSPTNEVELQRELSRVVAMVGPEIESAEETDFVTTNLEHYLVWKDLDGVIGISNIQFPSVDRMYVAISDRWYKVKRVQPDRETSTVNDTTTPVREIKGVVDLAPTLSKEYLVWKDENGVIGVGNIRYPDSERLAIAAAGAWDVLEKEPLPSSAALPAPRAEPARSVSDRLAEEISGNYLVWKDENGVVGIGNVQYPDQSRLTVAASDRWEAMKDEPLAYDPLAVEPVTSALKTESADISDQVSSRYLVWKDKNGHIGFGNIQYPETQMLSQVHANRTWEKVVN